MLTSCTPNGPDTGASTPTVTTGHPGDGKPTVVIGTGKDAEQALLGRLYATGLMAKGYHVRVQSFDAAGNLASLQAALQAGRIDMYPAYGDVLYRQVARQRMPATSATQTLRVAAVYEREHGATLLSPTPFQSAGGVAVTSAFADVHHLHSIADLSRLGPFSFGDAGTCRVECRGADELRMTYHLEADSVPMPVFSQYDHLETGEVETAGVLTTDAQLAGGRFVILSDPKHLYGFQHLVPVVDSDAVSRFGPQFGPTVNAVSAVLTQTAVISMNRADQFDHQSPDTVASTFLRAHHLA